MVSDFFSKGRIWLVSSLCLILLTTPIQVFGQQGKMLSESEAIQFRRTTSNPDELKFGKWDTVMPEHNGASIGSILGMQTVHVMLLPSGRVLMSSGSSWRNLDPIQTYPEYPQPANGTGLFDRRDDPFRVNKLNDYYQLVNNVAVFDPEENTFFRIPHPVPVEDPDLECHFSPNDMFCCGHLHLPNGNPLFVGGTQYYFPFRTGANTSYIFDWREELKTDWSKVDWRAIPNASNQLPYPWKFSGFMERGRWYPSLVPLQDGRLVVFSGFVGFDKGFPTMYQFEINHYVEFFDPSKFNEEKPEQAWRSVDVEKIKDSPFDTRIKKPEAAVPPVACFDMDFFDDWNYDPACEDNTAPCDCPPRCIKAHQFDAFKLYPNAYMFDKKRMYLSREGEWVSLRTPDTWYMRRTKKTYWMNIEGNADIPEITFDLGPDRPDTITSYGTSLMDPNTGKVTILGGQETSSGTLLPHNGDSLIQFAGGQGSRKKEVFNYTGPGPKDGKWELDENFFGDQPQDDRTMHYAVLLPTRQVLVLNGANYDFYGPIFYPLMLTPKFDGKGKFEEYKQDRMNEAIQPRLYHNSALLLPDGRVLVSGGNSARATVHLGVNGPLETDITAQPKPDLDLVDTDMYFFRDGQMGKAQKGQLITPTENWVAEIFSPPYLFIDGDRRANIEALTEVNMDQERDFKFSETVEGKKFYLIQSNQKYKVDLTGLPRFSNAVKAQGSFVLIKLPSVTHGWNSAQQFYQLKIEKLELTAKGPTYDAQATILTPDADAELLPPGFYMLFYVDAKGKPSVAQMVRFDDNAKAP